LSLELRARVRVRVRVIHGIQNAHQLLPLLPFKLNVEELIR
jgi:hypothetical protein